MKFHVHPATALVLAAFSLMMSSSRAAAQTASPTPNSSAAHSIPSIDGGIGTCSAAFTVSDENAAPVYDAKIQVHIAYGFMYLRKMDLQIGTNIDGKARFTGLPARTKVGLNFQATQADSQGTAFVDPNTTCQSTLTITLQKKP
ncbi:MAG TPA: hypothetical protein VIW68_02080 [Candidatus Sulfotelmatobacter sp.]